MDMSRDQKITRSIIIKGSPDDLYKMWTDFEMHPLFSDSIKEVKVLDSKISQWVMNGPMGKEIKWTAEMTRDDEGRRVAWRTIEGDIKNSGQVTFTGLPSDETQVTVIMQFVMPMAMIPATGMKMIYDPADLVNKDLKKFKEYAERTTGKNTNKTY